VFNGDQEQLRLGLAHGFYLVRATGRCIPDFAVATKAKNSHQASNEKMSSSSRKERKGGGGGSASGGGASGSDVDASRKDDTPNVPLHYL
jgi:uncharacterized membrane protein YgcG